MEIKKWQRTRKRRGQNGGRATAPVDDGQRPGPSVGAIPTGDRLATRHTGRGRHAYFQDDSRQGISERLMRLRLAGAFRASGRRADPDGVVVQAVWAFSSHARCATRSTYPMPPVQAFKLRRGSHPPAPARQGGLRPRVVPPRLHPRRPSAASSTPPRSRSKPPAGPPGPRTLPPPPPGGRPAASADRPELRLRPRFSSTTPKFFLRTQQTARTLRGAVRGRRWRDDGRPVPLRSLGPAAATRGPRLRDDWVAGVAPRRRPRCAWTCSPAQRGRPSALFGAGAMTDTFPPLRRHPYLRHYHLYAAAAGTPASADADGTRRATPPP